jgi:hypothetical protein
MQVADGVEDEGDAVLEHFGERGHQQAAEGKDGTNRNTARDEFFAVCSV